MIYTTTIGLWFQCLLFLLPIFAMVYKTKFLKKRVEDSYDPAADGTYTWELTDDVLAAIWLTIKGDLVAINQCIDDLLGLIDGIDVWFGGYNVVHYDDGVKAMMMNSLLKQSRPMIIGNGQVADDIIGCAFPILFGAPYLNDKMALPRDLTNRKTLSLTVDIADAAVDDLLIDIVEVILPGASPVGFIKQEQINQAAMGTGDKDVWLQRNWDLLKLLFHCPTIPADAAWTCTINRAGLEIDDFVFGYQAVPWEILHGELMDEITGMAGIENHTHLDNDGLAQVGIAEDLEHWIRHFAVMDFFFEKDLKWRAPLSAASTAKLKLNLGMDEAFYYMTACYVPTSKVR